MSDDGEDFSCQICGKQVEELIGANDFKHELIWKCKECYEGDSK